MARGGGAADGFELNRPGRAAGKQRAPDPGRPAPAAGARRLDAAMARQRRGCAKSAAGVK
jgi:hypothetical protein